MWLITSMSFIRPSKEWFEAAYAAACATPRRLVRTDD
jgi:hypothetical protein